MKPLLPLLLVFLFFFRCFSTQAISYSWNNAGSGDWSLNTNWMPNGVPGVGDDVTIGNGGTVMLDVVNAMIASLTISSDTLAGSNNISLSDALTLSGGTLNNIGAVAVGGAFTWSGGTIGSAGNTGTVSVALATTISTTTHVLLGKTLALNGGGTWSDGIIQCGQGSTLGVSGTLDITAPDGTYCNAAYGGSATFNVLGALTKAVSGNIDMELTFNNSGAVTVSAGTLTLGGGGTHTGSFSIGTGATINLSGGTHSFTNCNFTGTGTFLKSGGIVSTFTGNTIAPGASPGNLAITGYPLDMASNTYKVELASNGGPGIGHDHLQINSDITLGGNVEVSFLNGFAPPSGTFVILTYTGTASGALPAVSCVAGCYGSTLRLIHDAGAKTLTLRTFLADAGPDAAICFGQNATLTAGSAAPTTPFTYLWNTGATTASITVSPTMTTTYSVTVTDANGCTDDDSMTLTVHPLPVAVISPNGPTTFCQGNSVLLTASGGTSFAWNTGAVTPAITVSASGTYSVVVTDVNGCTDDARQPVTVHPLPTAVITPGGPTTFCTGGSVQLTASGGVSYAWSTSATTAAITALTNDAYSVVVTDANTCTDDASTFVTVGSTTITWTGGGDAVNWSNAANWSNGIVPLACQEVVIPVGSSVTVPTGFTAVGKTLEVVVAGQLTVALTGILTIEN